MPTRQLVGFQSVSLKVAETKTVKVTLPVERLRRWNETTDRYVVDSGGYQIAVGPVSNQPLHKAKLNVVR
jgi:beta-glucosidase